MMLFSRPIRSCARLALLFAIVPKAHAIPLPPTPLLPGVSSSFTRAVEYISSDSFNVTFRLDDPGAMNADVRIFWVSGDQPAYDSGFKNFSSLGKQTIPIPSSIVTSGTQYYWQAESIDSSNNVSRWSEPRYFTAVLVPAPPMLTQPGNTFAGSTVSIEGSLQFSVILPTAPVKVSKFIFTLVDTSKGQAIYTSDAINGSASSLFVNYFVNGDSYSWTAVSVTDGGQSAASPPLFFTAYIPSSLIPQHILLTQTSTLIDVGASVVFTGSGANTGYDWSVSPSGPSGIFGSGSSQTIRFPSEGNYTVTVSAPASATYAAAAPVTVTVTVHEKHR
jgi:hypothetical protein